MSTSASQLENRLTELRTGFDEAFALSPVEVAEDLIELAMIIAGGQRYAIQLRQLAGLEANLKVASLPVDLPGLLGLSAVRGHLVPIFDLASLLGAGPGGQAPRWVALHSGRELIGLGFDEFKGSRRVPSQALGAQDSAPGQQVIRVESGLVHVVDVPAVISRIAQARPTEPSTNSERERKSDAK